MASLMNKDVKEQEDNKSEFVVLDMPTEVPVQHIDDIMNEETKMIDITPLTNTLETPEVAPIVEQPVIEKTVTPEVSAEPQPVVETPVAPLTENAPVAEDTTNNNKVFETSNEDVIGKAKEIIAMDGPSGSVVLDEFLKHHDQDTNEALLGTLLYIDPVALNNNIQNENDYLNMRGINVNLPQEQGKGR